MDRRFKLLFFCSALSLVWLAVYIGPSGEANSILTIAPVDGVELIPNPSFDDNASSWYLGAWRFLDSTWADSNWIFEEGSVTMELATGLDQSFYCITIEQHLDQPILDKSDEYVVSWTGRMNSGKVTGVGVLGMGVNMFLDAVKDGVVTETLELYVFFYQDGFYTIPIGTYRDYGDRGTYWYETLVQQPSEDVWRFFYFHPLQLPFGETHSISFSLNKCLATVRQEAGNNFQEADSFKLTTISSVMEMLNAEGSFTTEYMSLKQLP